MPTIAQLPLAATVNPTDEIPISQGGVSRAVQAGTLLANLQPAITLATNALLGRASPGPGAPESIALGTGLSIVNDVLLVDHNSYPQTQSLDTGSTVLLNSNEGTPQLLPMTLLRGLYSPGTNIDIDENGVISSTPAPATGSTIGAVAVGEALVINASGQLSVNLGTVTGTAAAGNDQRIVGAEQTSNKNTPNGYCGLDVNGLVAVSQLPPFASSPVQSVNGQTGAVVLTANNISGLGSVATQSASNVSFTGGAISGVDASSMPVTPGLTGAVGRTLASHFSDIVDVNDFGLARDGVTDDSVAFTAACQAAMNLRKRLHIPAGGPILLTDAAQINLSNLCISGDGIRDYDSASGYGHEGSCLWFTGTTNTPFLLGPNVQFRGLNFFWPNQTEAATASNNNLPIPYPPLFAMQASPQNIVYFNFTDCQVTNCYDFLTASSTQAVVGACLVEACTIYAIRNCFTFTNNPEVFHIANNLFSWEPYGSVVSAGPTYNLRNFTNTQGCWLKIVGNGTTTQISSTTVGGIMSSNNYVYGASKGIWLAAGTLDISCFVDTSFDTVPVVLQADPGSALFSTRFTGGAWYPIYFTQTGNPSTTAIQINNPAPGGVGLNVSFAGITVPFVNGSFATVNGSNVTNLSFTDIRCNALGHTTGGTGPYWGFQFNTPNANIRVSGCDFQASYTLLSNTGVQILACTEAAISGNVFRGFSAPIDVETASGLVTLVGNVTQSTQGITPVTGIGTTNVRDLGNVWDVTTYAYNGFASNNYRAGATLGVMPVASTPASGYVGLQPSGTGSGGGTRFGISALGTSPVSLLTNAFNEEQFRANRVASAVNYISVSGAATGGIAQISTGGGDANAPLQIYGHGSGATYLGSLGTTGSPVVRLGGLADQSYALLSPVDGFSITVPANCAILLLKPSVALASGTVTLPAAFADGHRIEIWSSAAVNALTVVGASGTSVNGGGPFTLSANASAAFLWNAASNTWFQSQGSCAATSGGLASQSANAVSITGGTVTGLAQLGLGQNASAGATLTIDAAQATARQVLFQTAGTARFVAGVEGNAENNVIATVASAAGTGASQLPLVSAEGIAAGMQVSGTGIAAGTTVTGVTGNTVQLSAATAAAVPVNTSVLFYTNQGSDFAILPYDDSGAPLAPTLGQPLVITRATGAVNIKTLAVNGSATAPTPTTGDNSTKIATTAFVQAALSGAVAQAAVGAAGGVAALDATGRVPTSQLPASLQGALNYQGTWNAATNTPALASGTGSKGGYYTVATAGTTLLDGIGQWNAGDHAAFNGTVWEKLDGLASEVISVAGRTGAVVLSTADIAGLGTLATQSAAAVAVSGGSIDATVLGATTPAAGTFTTLAASSSFTLTPGLITVPSYTGIGVQGGGTAGAARGLGAFDAQQYRTAASQVASGQYAVVFGTNNTASAPGAIAVGGSNTVAGGTGYAGAFGGSHNVSGGYAYAFGNSHTLAGTYAAAIGFRARDFGRYGISLLASGSNASNGDAQRGETVLRAISTTSAAVRLTADGNAPGSANTLNPAANQVLKINVEIVGFNAATNAAACWFARDMLLARGATVGTTTLSAATLTAGGSIGTVSGWTAPALAADTTNGGLAVNSGYASGVTIKWVARIVSVEVM